MNIAVIGLGSMGKRRIRLIQKYNKEFNIIGIDKDSSRMAEAEKNFGIDVYNDLEKAINDYKFDCAFIATSPKTHYSIIHICLENKINVFTELNLINKGYDENIKLAKEKGVILFLSSTFLYREEIKYIKKSVSTSGKAVNYNYHVGQYLPDWHPWEDYRNFFVANKETNACREIFAIELPWMIDIFGEIKKIQVVGNKISDLNIDYKDNYLLIIEHKTGCKGILSLDIVSRKAVRNLEIYNEDIYLQWDGKPEGLQEYNVRNKEATKVKLYEKVDKLNKYSDSIIENAYYDEVSNFFETLFKKEEPRYSFERDKVILSWIEKIEKM